MKCPRCQQENPPQAKFCLECAASISGATRAPSSSAEMAEIEGLKRSLTEALEQQTATSEILRVISSSPTQVQPVLDAIAVNSARLCDALFASVYRFDGELIHMDAHFNYPAVALEQSRVFFPTPPTRRFFTARAILERAVVYIPDVDQDREYTALDFLREAGFRSVLSVPMLRDGSPVGAITVWGGTVGQFSDKQIALLQTFADQAIIAIENVRLFTELQEKNRALSEALEQQTATSEILRVISSSPIDIQPVLDAVAEKAARLCSAADGIVLRVRDGRLWPAAHHGPAGLPLPPEIPDGQPINRDWLSGRAVVDHRTVHVPDLLAEGDEYPLGRQFAAQYGHRTTLAVPMLREGQPVGVITVRRLEVRPFTDKQIVLLQTFADQAVIAIENVRLFRELQQKSQELEAASRHKSEFLANMSHELRTPLNAIIGFSEVLAERMFGDLNEKQEEYLKDIYASGQHLLSLINDILDLSKIEAGRMELELTDFNLPTTLDNALTLVRERAGRHGIALHMTVDDRVEYVRADERKIKQVILNLLSNAIKFTTEEGRIELRAVPGDAGVEVSVSDTGVGIAPEDQEAIFEEFRQVGTAAKKVEGTGLGLALSRKFIELHGGRIWVHSQVGVGSTFTFTIPAP